MMLDNFLDFFSQPVLAFVFDDFWHRFWLQFGTLLVYIGILFASFSLIVSHLSRIRVLLEVPFSLWHTLGFVFVSFWHPLAPLWLTFCFLLVPFGFHFPPFRGSPWNFYAISYHVLRCFGITVLPRLFLF